MSNKPYLTREQVKREARRSTKAAIRCSLRHWQELRDAIYEDLKSKAIWPDANFCALCQRFFHHIDSCDGCPLDNVGENCFNNSSVYQIALTEYKNFVACNNLNREQEYRKAAQGVVTVLQHCLRKVENE